MSKQSLTCLEAIHDGHFQVHHDEIRPFPAPEVNPFLAASGLKNGRGDHPGDHHGRTSKFRCRITRPSQSPASRRKREADIGRVGFG